MLLLKCSIYYQSKVFEVRFVMFFKEVFSARKPAFIRLLLKIKVLHDDIEEPFCLNGSMKNLKYLKNLSVSQNVLCGERRFFRL